MVRIFHMRCCYGVTTIVGCVNMLPCYTRHKGHSLTRFLQIIGLFLLLMVLIGCSRALKPSSPEDTPKNHYLAGLKLLGESDPAKPQTEFLRAILLDRKSPYGYTGIAALELKRQNYRRALKYANKALDRDRRFIEAAVLKGRIITERKKSGWYNRSKIAFQQAFDVEAENESALFYQGEASLQAFRFEEARGYFSKAAEKKGELSTRASERATLASRIMEANPASLKGKKVVLHDKATRADICILLTGELGLKDLVKSHRLVFFESIYRNSDKKSGTPQDMEEHGDLASVLDILALRLPDIDVYPNGNFYPDRTVDRSQLAMIVQEILEVLSDDQTLSTRFATKDSPFPDVRPDYYAFNAIMTVVERGIMTPESGSGRFNTDAVASGVDVLLTLRALKSTLQNN